MSKEVFGNRLASVRKAMGLSQAELSKKLNLSQTAIAKQETGKNYPSVELLEDYADFFGVTTDYLLGRVDYPNDHHIAKEKLPAEVADSGVEAIVKTNNTPLSQAEIERIRQLLAERPDL